jgi:hypothetical protein
MIWHLQQQVAHRHADFSRRQEGGACALALALLGRKRGQKKFGFKSPEQFDDPYFSP